MGQKMDRQLYEKIGNKYVPVNDPWACDGLSKGAWLVIVRPGFKSMKRLLNTNNPDLKGALQYLHDGLCESLREAGRMRPRSVLMSKKEQKACKQFEKTMGDDISRYFEYSSYDEMATKACEYVEKVMVENDMDLEKVKKNNPPKPKKEIKPFYGIEVDCE